MSVNSGRKGKETLADRAKRFVGDALTAEETEQASSGTFSLLISHEQLLIDGRLTDRPLDYAQFSPEASGAGAPCPTVFIRSNKPILRDS